VLALELLAVERRYETVSVPTSVYWSAREDLALGADLDSTAVLNIRRFVRLRKRTSSEQEDGGREGYQDFLTAWKISFVFCGCFDRATR